MNLLFTNSEIFTWVVLPLLIFLARVADVSLQTLRILFVTRGLKMMASAVGFFEVLIWLFAIAQIMQNLSNVACFLAYAGGFAAGNWVGILIEEKISLGVVVVRIVTAKDATVLIDTLRAKGHGVTSIEAQGEKGIVHLIFTLIDRADLPSAIRTIQVCNPNAFYSVEDVRMVSEGIFPRKDPFFRRKFFKFRKFRRKGK